MARNPIDDGDDPEGRRASDWLTGAIVFAVVGATILSFIVWTWVFAVDANYVERVQILTPFAVFFGASVTFLTVIWRGLISARQTNHQQRQIEALSRQLRLAEEVRISELLLKGSELVASDQHTEAVAGITALKVVSETPNEQFNGTARQLLIDYIRRNGGYDHNSRLVQVAIDSFNEAYERTGITINDDLVFQEDPVHLEHPNFDDHRTNWRILRGVKSVVYYDGTFGEPEIDPRSTPDISFNRTVFGRTNIISINHKQFTDCFFEKSDIKEIPISLLKEMRFRNCNFSGCRIIIDAPVSDLRAGNNYFLRSNPPIGINLRDGVPPIWSEVFLEVPKPPDMFGCWD